MTPLYRKKDDQITIDDFLLPFDGALSADNRWVIKTGLIPWDEIESDYSDLFPSGTGNAAKPDQVAFGALVIKETLGVTGEETVQQIWENFYLQYFLNYDKYTDKKSFTPSLMTLFRQRFSLEQLNTINEKVCEQDKKDDHEPPAGGCNSDRESSAETPDLVNKGKLIVDAICVPVNIRYPTDLSLLNEAREIAERYIDILYESLKDCIDKPRTYCRIARADYLTAAKMRQPRKKQMYKAARKQLGYLRRNLKSIARLEDYHYESPLILGQGLKLKTIRDLYRPQKQLYDPKNHHIEKRIASISQSYVQPIVRGKARTKIEFGAKLAISIVDGFAYMEKLFWDNFKEGMTLPQGIERYKLRHSYHPQSVHVDKIYRTRENIGYCLERGIRISGLKLGQPTKEPDPVVRRQARQDTLDRNASEGKRRYGLNLIKVKLKQTSEATIIINLIVMNLTSEYRDLFVFFSKSILRSIRACFLQLPRRVIPAVA